jgi:four helix bundle protein
MKENIIQDKSYEFAKKVIELYKLLKSEKEFELASQLLRSGTSIGANVEEAIGAYSPKDFLNKLTIAYKETRETKHWIKLLTDTSLTEKSSASILIQDIEEILKILGSIIKSLKEKMK